MLGSSIKAAAAAAVRASLLGVLLAGGAAQAAADAATPSVTITRVGVGNRSYAPTADLRLPQGTTSLHIDYDVAGLAAAGQVRFRLRLVGVDTQWLDVGDRRQAFYTHLGAGRFRFEVVADTGLPSPQPAAALQFTIEPAYYQTGWFRLLGGIAAFVLLWLLYLLRLRQMTLRLRGRLEERYRERERIARELHDTLLQSIQGLILRFAAVSDSISDARTQRMLKETLDKADLVLAEGRDRVRSLRDLALPIKNLCEAFAQFGGELSEIFGTPFRVLPIEGEVPLNPLVRDEIYQIGREALYNAYQHAQATLITVGITYGRDEFCVEFLDDGKGLDSEVLQQGRRPDHWGLPGMRERTEKLDGRFDISSSPDGGTRISLRIPAAIAYCVPSPWDTLKQLAGRAVANDVIP